MANSLHSADEQIEQPSETALDTARHQLNKVASNIDIDENIIERLNHPTAVHEVMVPLKRDDGTVDMFSGYRAQHDNVRGPYKGGLRFHPDVDREEVIGLSKRPVPTVENLNLEFRR